MTRSERPDAAAEQVWVTGKRAAMEAVRSGAASEVLISQDGRASPAFRELHREADRAGVPVRFRPRQHLDRIAEGHRGAAARIIPETAVVGERDLSTWDFGDKAIVVLLDGVTDPQNLGASARSAEAAGAAMIITRVHRGAPVTEAAVRASAGSLMHIPHARVANVSRAIERLQARGFVVVGLAGEADGSIFENTCPEGRIALVVGSEGKGLSRLVRERCDMLVRLPMRGRVRSLNASAALAAALYGFVLPSRTGE